MRKKKRLKFIVKPDPWVEKRSWRHRDYPTLRIEHNVSEGTFTALDWTSSGVILVGKAPTEREAKDLFKPLLEINGAGSLKHHMLLRASAQAEPEKEPDKPRRRLILRRR